MIFEMTEKTAALIHDIAIYVAVGAGTALFSAILVAVTK